MKLDHGIINGILVDGSGNKRLKKDIGIRNGRILSIGKINPNMVKNVNDVKGLVVSPDFIDIHSHSDTPLLVNPLADSKVRQGVSTEVIGNCGSSVAPLTVHALLCTRAV